MRITLSAAVTSDGYLDDNTPRRLMISTPEDWAAVLALRAAHDAILVGAETLRRDNPALLLRDEGARARRAARGLRPDLTKVTMTRSGRLSPAMRFFTEGDADRLVFSEVPVPALEGVAEVILPGAPLTAAAVVTELEKRGIGSLFVEGGARTLRQFFDAGLADTLRLAVNPALTLGPERGGARLDLHPDTSLPCRRERLNDGMEVAVWRLRADTAARDREDLALAIRESRRCVPCDTCYRVGAVIRTTAGELFTGYTHETSPTHHAEQEAILKATAAGAHCQGAAGGCRAARRVDLLLDGALLDTAERARKLHAADPAPRVRPRGLRPLRTRPLRLLPRSADPARRGRRRALLSRSGRRSAEDQCPPEALKETLFVSKKA